MTFGERYEDVLFFLVLAQSAQHRQLLRVESHSNGVVCTWTV